MTEQSKVGDVHAPDVPRPRLELQHITVPEKSTLTTSQPSSPIVLSKGPGVKYNCLCSPTTHAGSFRCRHHRNISRNSRSVGSKLNELAGDTWHLHYQYIGKSTISSTLVMLVLWNIWFPPFWTSYQKTIQTSHCFYLLVFE